MKRINKILGLVTIGLFVVSNSALAQEEIFRNGMQFGIGTRAIGMGGAYSAVGDDYSASFWNPAALAQIRRFEVSGGLSHLVRENVASFGSDFLTDDDISMTKLNEVGFAYPVPTYRGSLVFSFGYNQVKSFDSNFALQVFNSLPDDSVGQTWKEREDGVLSNWTIAGAIDLSPKVSAGVGINFWSGKDQYQFTTRENDDLNLYTFDTYRLDDSINSDFTGFNITLGGLYHINSSMQLSATISTPTTLTVNEEWQSREKTTFDEEADELSEDKGVTEYKIRSPYTFTGGGALNLAGLILVSGQIEYNDWARISYRSDPPIDGVTQEEANDDISEKYRSTLRYRLGAELTLPGSATQIRAGYYYDPSPFIADAVNDREYYSVGLGLLLDKQIKLDLAYVYGNWQEQNDGLNGFVTDVSEEITVNRIFATLSVRF